MPRKVDMMREKEVEQYFSKRVKAIGGWALKLTSPTIDEDVMKALKRKDQTQSELIDAVKVNLGGCV